MKGNVPTGGFDFKAKTRSKSTGHYNQGELIGGGAERRNWKGMVIALLVILIVCGFVILAVILSAENDAGFNFVSMEDVVNKKWSLTAITDTRWQSNSLIWLDEMKNIRILEDGFKNDRLLVSNITLRDHQVEVFDVSGSKQLILFGYNIQRRYSKSFFASYSIYNVANRDSKPIWNNHKKIEFAGFGPKDQQMIFISDGNIYYIPDANDLSKRVRVTDSSEEAISNGIADWFYEEEVLESPNAFWWSSDGEKIAFIQFDDTNVSTSFVTSYTKTSTSGQISMLQYPVQDQYPCPKAGFIHPVVHVKVYDVLKNETWTVPRPLNDRFDTIHSVTWTMNGSQLLVTWSNRRQNVAMIQSCDVRSSSCYDNSTTIQEFERKFWIPNLTTKVLPTSSGYFWVQPQHHGGRGYFNHISFYNSISKKTTFLTDGTWEASKLVYFDNDSKHLFYISNEQNPMMRHLYRISTDQKIGKPLRVCLTCNNSIYIQNCSYFDAQFSPKGDRVLVSCYGPILPRIFLVEVSSQTKDLNFSNWRPLAYYSKEEELHLSPNKALYEYKHGVVSTKAYDINYQLVIPIAATGKVNVIFEIADIGAQNVNNKYKLGFPEYMASKSNSLFVRVDGGGSSMRGEKILHSIIDDPAKRVLEDVLRVLEHLRKRYEVISVGIIGKYFGGHVAALASQEPEFSCGVAISPIVNWAAHTSIPTEKYFGLPIDDPQNYIQNNLLLRIKSFQEGNLLVFHGLKESK